MTGEMEEAGAVAADDPQGTTQASGGPADGAGDDAAARRAQRKKARLKAPPPERDETFDAVSLDQLRAMRAALADEETRVSYWRRIVQARIDVLRSRARPDLVAELGRLLSAARTSHRRLAHISIEPVEGLPPLPDLQRLWDTEVNPDDEEGTQRLLVELEEAERQLSEYRSELFRRIDRVTKELIARYRQDPRQALTALPGQGG